MTSLIRKVIHHYHPKVGDDEKMICPFHKERSPSLVIYDHNHSFYCFSGDTGIITKNGVKKIGGLCGLDVEILNGLGEWQVAPISYFGEQEIVKLHLTRNGCKKIISTTGEHNWYRRGRKAPVKTVDLVKGDRLESVGSKREFVSLDNDGVRHGICFGDGHQDGGTSCVSLYNEKIGDLSKYFNGLLSNDYDFSHREVGFQGSQRLFRLPNKSYKAIPSIDSDVDYLNGFIAGYLATDGHVSKDGTICLNSSVKIDLEAVRDICTRIGIRTYSITTQSRLGIDNKMSDIHRIHFVNEDLTSEMILRKTANERFHVATKKHERLRWVVEQVEHTGKVESVYCATVEGTHQFALEDNILTGNCFGCGESGNVFNWISAEEGIDLEENFAEARDKAMSILGITYEQYKEEKLRVSENEVVVDCLPEMERNDIVSLIRSTGYVSDGYRGIKDEYNKFFGHLSRLDDKGNVKARYYPETNTQGKIAGYKCRNHPKDFSHGNVGSTGSKNQLSGQVKFNSGGKYLLIVGGECDKVAAYQMLAENRSDKTYDSVAVVSPTTGENSCAKQVASQFAFCDMYDQIIIGMDNDTAGIEAAKAISAVLPKEKVKIALWSGKDPNKMLMDGKEKQFCRDFYSARPLVSSGIQNSEGLLAQVKDELMRPRIGLPPHWHKVQKAMKGGILQGRMVNIIGDTSVGKTTHVNDLVYYWLFNAPEKVGVVSLEATAGQYTIDLLSIHLEKNLMWIGEGQDIIDYLDRPDVMALYDNLLTNEFGESRFAILDERDGNIKMLEAQCEKLINQYGCRILVIDVLTDILRGANADAQEDHMMWQKRILKTGVTIVNVLHTRKPPTNADGSFRKATEYDAFGSSSFVQSAAYNIVVSRDKMESDPIKKNLTYVDLPKARGGITGPVTEWYYDGETRKVVDYGDWMAVKYSQSPVSDDPPARMLEPEF